MDTVNTSSVKQIREFIHSFNPQTMLLETFGGGMSRSAQEVLLELKRFGCKVGECAMVSVFLLSGFPLMV